MSAAHVDENWRRLREVIGAETPIARCHQVHGKTVRIVTRENISERPEGDGMVTAEPGILLAVASADCVPILMMDARCKIVGAIHAGWRGVIAGIAQEGVRAMESLGAKPHEIRAALGPSIGQCCFEVDEELAQRFAREVAGSDRHSRAGTSGKIASRSACDRYRSTDARGTSSRIDHQRRARAPNARMIASSRAAPTRPRASNSASSASVGEVFSV